MKDNLLAIVEALEADQNISIMSGQTMEDLSFDDMVDAVNKIPKRPDFCTKMKVCKKHYKEIASWCDYRNDDVDMGLSGVAQIYGIKIFIKPYLKKARMYFDSGKIIKIDMRKKNERQ